MSDPENEPTRELTLVGSAPPLNTPAASTAAVRAGLDIKRPIARRATSAWWLHPEVATRHAHLLRLDHAICRATVPLLRVATEEATRRAAADDSAARGLIEFLHHRVAQELHHDDWLLEDYAVLDRDPAEVLDQAPPPTVAGLVGAIYYWIVHVHPIAVLGHLGALHVVATSPAPPAELQRRTGHPAAAFRTLAHHVERAPHQADELWALLDRIPLDAVQLDLVLAAAHHTVDGYVAALRELTFELDGRSRT